jgi:hypothetical protein
MLVTASGIVKLEIGQPENAASPMLVTESGIAMLVKLLQLWNALLPMIIKEAGKIMLVKLLQLWNAP